MGTGSNVGGLAGRADLAGTFTDVNYFVDSNGTNGLGSGTCANTICVQATGTDAAARRTWLADSLDETLDDGLNWDAQVDADSDPYWGNLNASGTPCLRNMPMGAPACS